MCLNLDLIPCRYLIYAFAGVKMINIVNIPNLFYIRNISDFRRFSQDIKIYPHQLKSLKTQIRASLFSHY